jgi:hypothetical protein
VPSGQSRQMDGGGAGAWWCECMSEAGILGRRRRGMGL